MTATQPTPAVRPDELLPRPAPKRALVDGPLVCVSIPSKTVDAPLVDVLADAVAYLRRIPSDCVWDLTPNWSMDTGWVIIVYLQGGGDTL